MTFKKSPNFTVSTIPKIGYVIHGTLGNYEGAINWLCTAPNDRNPVSYSSSHYVISKLGDITQLVLDKDIAWHAGTVSNPTDYAKSVLPKSLFGYKNPNETFIGIELEWFIGDTVTEAQYSAIKQVVSLGTVVKPIILSHKEIADYKADFSTADGKIDLSVSARVRNMIVLPVESPQVDKMAIKTQIINLINQL